MGGLYGFRRVMILPVFQIDGIMQLAYEKLAIFVRVVIPCGPRCLR